MMTKYGGDPEFHDLPGGGEAYEQLTAACEQFFGDENCERCADDPSDNSYLLPGK